MMKKLFAFALAAVMLLTSCVKPHAVAEVQPEPSEEPQIVLPVLHPKSEELNAMLEENMAINEDCVGKIWFDSGLIDLPVVQGASNDTYLRTDWETMEYSIYGSIFMDYRNVPEDQNIIIYGHYAYPSKDPERKIMFTPLEKFTDGANYEDNKYFNLFFDNEVRKYQVAMAFYAPIYKDANGYEYIKTDMEYFHTNYDSEYFKTYKDAIFNAAFFDSGVDIDMSDKLVTLQTCVMNRDDLRMIVIGKEIGREVTK